MPDFTLSDGPRVKPLTGSENFSTWKEAMLDYMIEKKK
jgi:hypothetical protein